MTTTSTGAAAGRGTTAAPVLFPTKTRLELLHAAQEGRVFYNTRDGAVDMEIEGHRNAVTVTVRFAEAQRAGWVEVGSFLSDRSRYRFVRLTDHGRQVVDGGES